MPVIKYKHIIEKLCKKPVFSLRDAHDEGLPKGYAKKLLHSMAKQGRIKRIEKGKYTCLDDPIAVAGNITQPCYLSLWTAMRIRNITTQVPFSIDVMTSRKR